MNLSFVAVPILIAVALGCQTPTPGAEAPERRTLAQCGEDPPQGQCSVSPTTASTSAG
jgi:hypothetical protein